MQISGRVIILAAFGLAIAMSGGAWWYHYTQVRQAAAFWGPSDGRLLVRGPEVTFFKLGEASESVAEDAEAIADRPIASMSDLSDKQGLVHLRHALYQDSNFQWEGRRREAADAANDWKYAVRFGDGDAQMTALFPRDFSRVGHLTGDEIDVLPSPRISASVQRYLTDIGALKEERTAR
jgi:hypothetical protein